MLRAGVRTLGVALVGVTTAGELAALVARSISVADSGNSMTLVPHLLPKVEPRLERVGSDDDSLVGEIDHPVDRGVMTRPFGPTAAVGVAGLAKETQYALARTPIALSASVILSRTIAAGMLKPTWWYRFSYVAEALRDDPKAPDRRRGIRDSLEADNAC